ncbi:MAG: glycosyltransferase family 2 protein [Nitrospira sp.]|nr:MAG: glycosyltransferase family 2 protein [Nitrospira sp.]
MNAATTKVSVGIPVYNGERFLAQTIESILGQTYTSFELIISDNGSTDRTKEIGQAYASRDPRVKFVRSETNKGASWNYQRTFELGRGEYFRWAPSDDLFAPDSLAECVAALDASPDAVLCYPKTDIIDSQGQIVRPYEDNLDLRSPDPVERFRQGLAQIGLVNVIYGLMRSDALRKTRLMGTYVGADEVLVLELALYGKFLELPRSRFYRRMHEKAFSQMKTSQEKQSFFDPATAGRFYLYLWQHYQQYWLGILHSPLALEEKVRAMGVLARSAISLRHNLFKEVVLGTRQLFQPRSFFKLFNL